MKNFDENFLKFNFHIFDIDLKIKREFNKLKSMEKKYMQIEYTRNLINEIVFDKKCSKEINECSKVYKEILDKINGLNEKFSKIKKVICNADK